METRAAIVSFPSAVAATAGAAPIADTQPGQAAEKAEANARYRLIIEEGPTDGTFVYKTMDRVTGEIVRQFPREQIMQMSASDRYASGNVIDTSA